MELPTTTLHIQLWKIIEEYAREINKNPDELTDDELQEALSIERFMDVRNRECEPIGSVS